jgi:hypothetical protein
VIDIYQNGIDIEQPCQMQYVHRTAPLDKAHSKARASEREPWAKFSV